MILRGFFVFYIERGGGGGGGLCRKRRRWSMSLVIEDLILSFLTHLLKAEIPVSRYF